MPESNERKARKSVVGVVTSDKMDKTRRVEIQRLEKHPRYGKYLRHKTVCKVHDENNESRQGDKVEIRETRPLSKTKRWRLVKILVKAPDYTAQKKPAEGEPQLQPETQTAPEQAETTAES